ncbi:formate/nitrite transporter family protein [Niabella beijingensis]|uniref:formate/nitrite transporter family protein n=1 Tax=Niabella beijingensis TaxID=2872700 RepID=UPI001CBB815E|nr:formate/nitrite transporter family protein [Niabella beijingensis]MBZ4190203.1 formate/nitrite transporter family protein [Niabella beijingensis]
MDYKKPAEVIALMIQAGTDKGRLGTTDLFIRGALSGMLLGIGTTLAVTGSVQTGIPIVGALLFPICFVVVVLMGLELVTGSFALLPAAYFHKNLPMPVLLRNLAVVYGANLFGSLLYAFLFWASVTGFGQTHASPLIPAIIKIAEAKTTGYAQLGGAGIATAFTKGILCNWMVSMGVVLALTSSSTIGKILAAWIPVFMFFAQGFEHAVVNMFLIPEGILLGAPVTVNDWWLYNQIPVTLGNIVGALLFTAGALYLTYGRKKQATAAPENAHATAVPELQNQMV